MDLDPELQEQIGSALEAFLSEDSSTRDEVFQFLHTFKNKDQILFTKYLINHLSNDQTTEKSRAIAAIFLYSALHKQTPEQQRQFVPEWNKINIEIRDQLRASALEGISSEEPDLQRQCSNLLGIFYALENYIGNLEASEPSFLDSFNELLDAATESDPDFRILLFNIFSYFASNSLEFDLNCHSKRGMSNLSPRIYEVFLDGLNSDYLPLQIKALQSFTESFLIFKRIFSFPANRAPLLDAVFQLIQIDEPELVIPTYQLLITCIDCCYNEMAFHMEDIEAITLNDLQSDDSERQIEACFLWSVIAEVENDILNDDRQVVKKIHLEFRFVDDTPFSRWAFDELFDILVDLICSTNPDETDANISLDRTPSHAAFSCLNLLTRAADADYLARSHSPDITNPLDRIYEWVDQNAESEDWRQRYTAALLLNGASQVKSMDNQYNPKNVLVSYDFFVNAIIDPIPRVSDAAMYSAGGLIKKFPELVINPDLFSQLCENIVERMNISDELTSRACWLLNICFSQFSREDEESPLVENFDMFSELLLDCSDKFDVNAQFSALGALDRLVEHTPSTISEQYNRLFEAITGKLQALIEQYEDGNILNNAKYTQQMIGLLSLVHHIVMNVGPMITDVSDQLMEMLITALDFQNGNFVCEVLPAMGAVARAVQQDFSKYLPNLIEKVFEFLDQGVNVSPAAVFIADIFNSSPDPPFAYDLIDKFVEALSETLKDDALPSQTRLAVFSALANIAFYIEDKCEPWIDDYLSSLDQEMKSILTNKEDIDRETAISFTIECLNIYSGMLPIIRNFPKSEKRVKNFFNIFEKLDKLNFIKRDVLGECVVLIRQIADMYQKVLNVLLNKPAVLHILQAASDNNTKNDNPQLYELAKETFDLVRQL